MEKQLKLKQKYIDLILALLALSVMPLYLYGTRILSLLGISLVTSIVVDYICIRLSGKKRFEKYDYSCIITALVTVLLLPATVPFWVVMVAVSVGLIIAKHPFGGSGYNIFNPAAVGVAFVAICWPEFVLRYPIPFSTKGVIEDALIPYTNSIASVLKVNGTPPIGFIDVMLGRFAGPMGATCMIVIATCLLYLVFRKVISLRIVLSTTLVVALFAIVFQRVSTGTINSLVYEFSAGALFFGLVFMANDPTSIPKTKAGQILFGLILGVIIMLFRHFGAIELEFVYAILLANIFAIPCDRYASYINKKLNRLTDIHGDSKTLHPKTDNSIEDNVIVKDISEVQPVRTPKLMVVSEVLTEKPVEVQINKEQANTPTRKPTNTQKNKKKSVKNKKADRNRKTIL